jgi:hypothetical protein
MAPSPTPRNIVIATLLAAAVGFMLLIGAILPAEYGIDPTGIGRALGLTALADAGRHTEPATAAATLDAIRPGVNTPQSATLKHDRYEVELRPFEGVEYKYRLEKGAAMVYSWTASAPVAFEFHGEPDGAPDKYFESYQKSDGATASGSFLAPTTGIHGWYWKNPGVGRITVTLTSTGFYTEALELRDGEKVVRPLNSERPTR